MQEFFSPIFVTLATDHKGFLDDAEKRDVELGVIEGRLKSAEEALKRKQPGGSDNS